MLWDHLPVTAQDVPPKGPSRLVSVWGFRVKVKVKPRPRSPNSPTSVSPSIW